LNDSTPPRGETLWRGAAYLAREDLAEEVIQEAYVKIWNSAGQFNRVLFVADYVDWWPSPETGPIDVVR